VFLGLDISLRHEPVVGCRQQVLTRRLLAIHFAIRIMVIAQPNNIGPIP
jgi:hypothetical protein